MSELEPSTDQNIPVVDLRDWGEELTSARFAREFGEALRDFGFVRVRGHLLAEDHVEEAYTQSQQFFELPTETKVRYVVANAAGQRGYTPFRAESAKDRSIPDLKEFWHVGRQLDPADPLRVTYGDNVWPDEVSNFRSSMTRLYEQLDSCASRLLDALAFFLDVEPEFFTTLTDRGDAVLRVLHYPALEDNTMLPGAVRAAAHEDINLITLLVSSTNSGLEIQRRDGSWLTVRSEPGEIIVDSGDMMSRITGGYLPATTHRVRNPDDEQSARFSLPFFVHPRPDAVLSVIPHFKDPSQTHPHEDITAGEFLRSRLSSLGLV